MSLGKINSINIIKKKPITTNDTSPEETLRGSKLKGVLSRIISNSALSVQFSKSDNGLPT